MRMNMMGLTALASCLAIGLGFNLGDDDEQGGGAPIPETVPETQLGSAGNDSASPTDDDSDQADGDGNDGDAEQGDEPESEDAAAE